MGQVERQELHCHNCNKYVQFDLDLEMDGNHVLKCPSCGHEHCRVVQKGKITDTRWDSRMATPPPCDCGATPGEAHKDTCPRYVAPISKMAATPPKQMVGPNGMPVFYIPATNTTYTTISTYATYQGTASNGTGNVYLYQAWMNSTANAS